MSKLSINSVEDIKWLPTCHQVEPIQTDSDDDTIKPDDDQVSVISISSQGSVTSMSSISIFDVDLSSALIVRIHW